MVRVCLVRTGMKYKKMVNSKMVEHIENFTKERVASRDLGNRASPVERADMKRPLIVIFLKVCSFFVSGPLIVYQSEQRAQLRPHRSVFPLLFVRRTFDDFIPQLWLQGVS